MNFKLVLGAIAIMMVSVAIAPCRMQECPPESGKGLTCDSVRCSHGADCQMINGQPQCVCRRACTKIYDPVCGSDENTYANPCELDVHNCVNQQDVQVAYKGRCQGENSPEVADN